MQRSETRDAAFGIVGMDDILAGGLERERVYLLEGAPGTGKTTSAMRFLLEGAATGERGLYITLSETENELRATASAHGWALEGVDIFELVPPESLLDENQQLSRTVARRIRRARPQMRHSAQNPYRRDRQLERLSGRHAPGAVSDPAHP